MKKINSFLLFCIFNIIFLSCSFSIRNKKQVSFKVDISSFINNNESRSINYDDFSVKATLNALKKIEKLDSIENTDDNLSTDTYTVLSSITSIPNKDGIVELCMG